MSYEQVLEITKFIRKIGKRFDIFFDLKKLSDWAEEFLECDLRDLKASGELLMRDPMRRPTPAIILQCVATSKARRLSEEREEIRKMKWQEGEKEVLHQFSNPDSFQERLRKGMSQIFFHSHTGTPKRRDSVHSFLEEMRRDFPEMANNSALTSIEQDLI